MGKSYNSYLDEPARLAFGEALRVHPRSHALQNLREAFDGYSTPDRQKAIRATPTEELATFAQALNRLDANEKLRFVLRWCTRDEISWRQEDGTLVAVDVDDVHIRGSLRDQIAIRRQIVNGDLTSITLLKSDFEKRWFNAIKEDYEATLTTVALGAIPLALAVVYGATERALRFYFESAEDAVMAKMSFTP